MSACALVRESIRFTGRVQGVGFRYTTRALALAAGLSGWVRNESDGAVTAEFQGSKPSIDAVVAALNGQRFIQIEHTERSRINVLPGERGYQITG